jgi:hypothetical protein
MTDELKTYKDFFNQLKNCKTTNRSFLKDLYTLILEVDEECSKNAETLKFIIELRDFIIELDDVDIEDINSYVGGDGDIDDEEDDDGDVDEEEDTDEEFENLKEEFEQLISRIAADVNTASAVATTASAVANVSATTAVASTEPLKDIRSEMIDLIDDFLKNSECDAPGCFAVNLTDQLIDYYEKHEGLKKDKTLQSFLYEFLGYIHKDFYATIDDMKNHSIVEWDASIFEECKTFRRDALSKVMFKPVAIKGLDFCYKCKGDEFTYWQAQTRGNDEQITTFRLCINCKF